MLLIRVTFGKQVRYRHHFPPYCMECRYVCALTVLSVQRFVRSSPTLLMIDDYNDDDRQMEYNFSSMLNPVKCNRRKDIKQVEFGVYNV